MVNRTVSNIPVQIIGRDLLAISHLEHKLKTALSMLSVCSEAIEQFSSNEYVYGMTEDYLLTDIQNFVKECNENSTTNSQSND